MHSIDIKVRIFETDLFGRTHFSSYFRYIDMASSDFFESIGIDPKKLRYLPVAQSGCTFRAPTEFNDILEVRTFLTELKEKSLRIVYQFYRRSDRVFVAEGYQVLVAINEKGHATMIPNDLREVLSRNLEVG